MENTNLSRLAASFNRNEFRSFNEEISFSEYLDRVYANPLLIRTAFQRIYDMIMSAGSYTFEKDRETLTHYNFFDPYIFGLEKTLDQIVKFIRGAAGRYGTEKRILLLTGPVGSSKSTIARCLKRGLENYTRTDEGVVYTFKWVNLPTGAEGIYTATEDLCPMHDDPIKLIEEPRRSKVIAELNDIYRDKMESKWKTYQLWCDGELDPRSQLFMDMLLAKYDGDWEKVVKEHIRVVRFVMSESKRKGIATFQPKDEKNQDATELTGDVDFSKMPHFGKDSDPRAFSFDGELCKGNRGLVEFIEMLKLQQEFLYDLLGASQEKQIKPKKFSQVVVDQFLLGHTNIPEYEKLKNNAYMDALKDRTVNVDVPYLLKVADEIKVLANDYNPSRVRQHIAPHTLETVALWSVLTRLEDDNDGKIDIVKKAKLYNDEAVPGYEQDTVKELHEKHPNEGMYGISVRYVQDKISNCLSANHDYINPFMVMHEIREGLDNYPLINKKEDLSRYHTCAEYAIKQLDETLKDEVRKALVGDEKTIERLCANYIDNVMAYIGKKKVKNPYTQRDEMPNERLMRSIEEKIDVSDQMIDDFRRMIAAFIGDLAHEKKTFSWKSNADLKKALQDKLFEDIKDHIKLSALHVSGAATVQPDLQEKIDHLKKRLIDQYGYNDQSATDVLNYVGSLFAASETSKDD